MRRMIRILAVGLVLATSTPPAAAAEIEVDQQRDAVAKGVLVEVGTILCSPDTTSLHWQADHFAADPDSFSGYSRAYGPKLVFTPADSPGVFASFAAGQPVRIIYAPADEAELDRAGLRLECRSPGDQAAVNLDFDLVGQSFTDVAPGAFYDYPSLWALLNGVTTGTSDTTFSPGGNVSRWQMALFLQRMAELFGIPALSWDLGDPFTDTVTLQTYKKNAIGWLAATGITTGVGGGLFGPDIEVSRWQMALFIQRFAEFMGLAIDTAGPLDTFSDTSTLSDDKRRAIGWLAETGITTGVGDNRFDPNGVVSRGQMVTFLERLYLYLLDQGF